MGSLDVPLNADRLALLAYGGSIPYHVMPRCFNRARTLRVLVDARGCAGYANLMKTTSGLLKDLRLTSSDHKLRGRERPSIQDIIGVRRGVARSPSPIKTSFKLVNRLRVLFKRISIVKSQALGESQEAPIDQNSFSDDKELTIQGHEKRSDHLHHPHGPHFWWLWQPVQRCGALHSYLNGNQYLLRRRL